MIKAIGKHLVVKKLNKDEVRKGALILKFPTKNNVDPFEATVIHKGEKVVGEIREKDVVLVSPFYSVEYEEGEEVFLVVKEENVLGVLR